MSGTQEKFAAIRKGLLEFLILKIISADKVYVADMLARLSDTEFATQEGTLYPLLSKMRARSRSGTYDSAPARQAFLETVPLGADREAAIAVLHKEGFDCKAGMSVVEG